jgi:hypothetical protein
MIATLSLYNHGETVCQIQRLLWTEPPVEGRENECVIYTESKIFLGLDDAFSIECEDGIRRDAYITRSGVDVMGWHAFAKVRF